MVCEPCESERAVEAVECLVIAYTVGGRVVRVEQPSDTRLHAPA